VKIVAGAVGTVFAAFVALCGLLVLVVSVATGATPPAPTASAVADIPPGLLAVYRDAAATCPMPWSVVAAIGKIESDHGRSNLPGVHEGANSAGAKGPMQFLPSTWTAYGADGDHDGRADVYDQVDAIWGAVRYLCANGAGNAETVRGAIWAYNHADWYVDQVLAIAASYTGTTSSGSLHAMPLDRSFFERNPELLAAPHHDYPAIDIPVPVGDAVFAVGAGTVREVSASAGACGGTVIIDGDDGVRYTYCHLSDELTYLGARVNSGDAIAQSGGAPGTSGAGDSTGPHLHLGMSIDGVAVCPQDILSSWFARDERDPRSSRSTGCVA
jgi:hypothetical protein